MNKLLIVGTVAFDAIETPFGKTDKILGGAATFIGLSASHFNVKSGIVSVVGEDFPQEYLNLLTERNIDISGIEIVKGGKTFFWSGRYHNDMNSRDTLATELNVLADFNPVVPQDFKNAEAESPIKVAAPPKILSVFPKGVSIASKATVPTINNLFIKLKLK